METNCRRFDGIQQKKVKLYGEPGSPCKKVKDDNGNDNSMCDNIEKLRAEYNKVVDNKVADKK